MTNAYQLHNIKVNYDQQCVLDIAELSITQNECIALLGDNGAGKSTLLNLLAFTAQASEGQIILSGQPAFYPLSKQQRQSIGYVAQHPLLLKGSVLDNVLLALKLQGIKPQYHKKLAWDALDLVNLTQHAKQTINTLSGGELKRAAIARAIAYQPDILLLDEPFSHLDLHHFQLLETIIQQVRQQKNKTIIFSTHNRLHGLSIADSTINLVQGKITESPLINLFRGKLHNHVFNTGKLKIHTISDSKHAHNIAIDPHEIIVSRSPLESSMRNSFNGRLTLIAEEGDVIRLTIDCNEIFHALISRESLSQLGLTLGDIIYLSFKSTATKVF
ncbi:MAG: ATP-binding cassette domain-containing protein [Gammaproteobacteria bacterium]|nr:ATP-binding cassette domain-containing protein [Gammaproteobacteria bacterium]